MLKIKHQSASFVIGSFQTARRKTMSKGGYPKSAAMQVKLNTPIIYIWRLFLDTVRQIEKKKRKRKEKEKKWVSFIMFQSVAIPAIHNMVFDTKLNY